jgi:outer membrane protein insertion porin family
MYKRFLLLFLIIFSLSGYTVRAQPVIGSTPNLEEDEVDNVNISATHDIEDMKKEEEEAKEKDRELDLSLEFSQGYASAPKKYIIAEITVSGVKFFNTDQVIGLSGLAIGDTISIPGDQISQAIKRIWKNGLFSDAKMSATKVVGDKIYLDIHLQERPRIVGYSIEGVKKSDREDLQGMLYIRRGSEFSDYLKTSSINIIKKFYDEKGYKNAEVELIVTQDTSIGNGVRVTFKINRGQRVRVREINFEGNKEISSSKLRGAMKNVHRKRWYTFFWSSKYIESKLDEDEMKLIDYYNERGYRDAQILDDSVWKIGNKEVGILYKIYEGNQYYYRSIKWVGNTKYPSEFLTSNVLRIESGDIYDKVTLRKRLFEEETSVSTMYNDEGYLFFNVQPVEVKIEGDSVDLELRVYEGKPATINNIYISGNSKTNEHIIRRELYTRPGDLFSKTNIIRSIRDLAQMGHFNPETLNVDPVPNPADETVDITYIVEEKPNDQIELSGGWGANTFVGTVGIRLTNFSARRMFKKEAWKPLPSGDNQQLSLRFQTNGSYYKAASLSFTEPWLGGKKPVSLSTSLYYTNQNDSYIFYQSSDRSMQVIGASIGIGQRLKWPDNYFTLYSAIDLQRYILKDWPNFQLFTNGSSNNFSLKTVFGRNSTDQPIYPRRGSELSIGLQLTLPYSLFNGIDYKDPDLTTSKKYRWIEYHKWSFRTVWYATIWKDMVLASRIQFGYLGYYNKDLGYSPFEGFEMGGDGLSGYNLYGVETVGLRGYENGSLTPNTMANVYEKFTMELRYPAILSPQSTIYAYAFVEAGNAWYTLKDYRPFSVKRSAGLGARVMLPMIGLIGVSWAYGFDNVGGDKKNHVHFEINLPF